MELPLRPEPEKQFVDQDQRERFIEHESQDRKPYKHRYPAGRFGVFETETTEAYDDAQ